MKKLFATLFSVVSAFSMADFDSIQTSIYQQPIQIHCNVSTRVVASDLFIGINPMLGSLQYTVKKYHATKAEENYSMSGNNHGFMDQTLSFNRLMGGGIGIHGSYTIATRAEYKQVYASFHFRKDRTGIYLPGYITINGKNVTLGDFPHCTVTGA